MFPTRAIANRAARILGPGHTLILTDVEASRPGRGQVLVRNHAVAVQPLDAKMLLHGYGPNLNYPAVLGTSGAGVIEEVGDDVVDFAVGDRIVFDTRAYVNTEANLKEGTWQKLVVANANTVAKIDDTSFEQAVLVDFPLQTAVAALRLFMGMGAPGTGSSGEKVLIWGAGGAVGLYAAQYAKSAGHTVVVTASPRDAEHQKKLGAAAVVDYKAADAVERLRQLDPYKYMFTASGDAGSQQALASLLQPQGGKFGSVLGGDIEIPANVERVYSAFSMAAQAPENEKFRSWWYQEYLPQVLTKGLVEPARFVKVNGGLAVIQQTCAEVSGGKIRGKVIINPQE